MNEKNMNKYNHDIHHRRFIRLRGYDYSQEGLYFVTTCTQNRACLFGNITDGAMRLNEIGRMVENEWLKLPERFNNVVLDVFQIMSNHFHGILQIVGAGLAPAPNDSVACDNRAGMDNNEATAHNRATARVAPTIGNIIGAFKSLVTNECLKIFKSKNEYLGKLWQHNYYEHIIRDHNDYARIAGYIADNPANWANDDLYDK
jgi:REP element-mobilizing transposase RayT